MFLLSLIVLLIFQVSKLACIEDSFLQTRETESPFAAVFLEGHLRSVQCVLYLELLLRING